MEFVRHLVAISVIFHLCSAFVTILPNGTSNNFFDGCTDEQFKCKNGLCVARAFVCDHGKDCLDGSDELNCNYKPCDDTEFRCSSMKCIKRSSLCDDVHDCTDGDDEEKKNCPHKVQCNSTQFSCDRGSVTCIPRSKLCDGEEDCEDMSDESSKNCKSLTPSTCRQDEFTCHQGGCISKRFMCNGEKDCADGSDEFNCTRVGKECGIWQYRCSNNTCIPLERVCDNNIDCPGGSDEKDCPSFGKGIEACPFDKDLYCGIPGKCVSFAWVCDGIPDCPNGADERNCGMSSCAPPKIACNHGNKCIHPSQKCDGVKDCPNGSDELHCNLPNAKENECKGKFMCRSKEKPCVDWSDVCNNHLDCLDGEDEKPFGKKENCNLNPCKFSNGGCTHKCINRYTNYYCGCPKGLKLLSDNKTCVDIDECKLWGSCSQKCENTKGSFKCSCELGYDVASNNKSGCIANSPKSLLLGSPNYIRQLFVENHEDRFIIDLLTNANDLDYDIHAKPRIVFWTSLIPPSLRMTTIKTATDKTQLTSVVYNQSRSSPGRIAYDWVHKLMYMSDNTFKRIIVLNITNPSKFTVLIKERIDEASALAVDPAEGWLYWGDWGARPMISKMGMDGSHRRVIVDTRIEFPNAIALDLPRRRLYWCDAGLHSISSVDLNGNDRRLIFKHEHMHPYSMAVFEDNIYWSDWNFHGVMSVNKFYGSAPKKVFELMGINALRVMHRLMQPLTRNRCRDNPCSHICLPSPVLGALVNDPGYVCACPENYVKLDDDRTCVKNNTVRSTTEFKTSVTKSPELRQGTTLQTSTTIKDKTSPTTKTMPTTDTSRNVPTSVPTLPKTRIGTLNTTINKEVQRVGHVAGVAIGVIVLILLVFGGVMLVLYRIYSQKNIRSMNFDNPVYRKANGDGDPEARFPMNGSLDASQLSTRAPIWTGASNDAVEA